MLSYKAELLSMQKLQLLMLYSVFLCTQCELECRAEEESNPLFSACLGLLLTTRELS